MNKFWCVYVPRGTAIYYVVATIVAMFLYPGGNHLELEQHGYSLIKNFLSELGRYKTMSGDVNFLSSFLFWTASCITFFQGVAFLFVPRLFDDNKASLSFAIIGGVLIFIGNIFFVAVGFTPEDLYFDQHIFVANAGFNLTSLAIFSFAIAIIFSRLSNYYALGAFILFILVTIYSVYISSIPEINPSDRELYIKTISMDFLIFKVVMQKLIVATLIINVIIFTYGLNQLIDSRGYQK